MVSIKKISLIFVIILWMVSPGYSATDLFKGAPEEPLEITANKMEAFHEKNLVIFSGNACVIRGNISLKSDRIYLYYKKEPDKKQKTDVIKTADAGELDKVEAKGNVLLIQGDRTASGDEALYLRESNKIIMTGNAMLKEGKNIIRGDRAIVFLNEDRGVVESDPHKQVKAVIYPRETKEKN
jgi:lipopolysaccharide export system protein LptA